MIKDAIGALRSAVISSERIGQLSKELTEQSQDVRAELKTINYELREVRDRVSRLEGGLSVLNHLKLTSRD
tara:strand:- start:142 stop:354 length:213 start_codon:yes stop_codon:yes gene_type:complete